jgi:hypothetical protein
MARRTSTTPPAFDLASGRVIGDMSPRQRAEEFRRSPNLTHATVPGQLGVHVVLDKYSTHKTQMNQRWLLRHPRFHLLFTSTTSRD